MLFAFAMMLGVTSFLGLIGSALYVDLYAKKHNKITTSDKLSRLYENGEIGF